jgi:hypothetical protein
LKYKFEESQLWGCQQLWGAAFGSNFGAQLSGATLQNGFGEPCFGTRLSVATLKSSFGEQLWGATLRLCSSIEEQLLPEGPRKLLPKLLFFKAIIPQNYSGKLAKFVVAPTRLDLNPIPQSGSPKLFSKTASESCSPKLLPKAAPQSCVLKLLPKAAVQSYRAKLLPKAAPAPQTYSTKLFPKAVPQSCFPKLFPKVVPQSYYPNSC